MNAHVFLKREIICTMFFLSALGIGGCKKKCDYCDAGKLVATWKLNLILSENGDTIMAEPGNANRPMLLTFTETNSLSGTTLGNRFEGTYTTERGTNKLNIDVHYTTLVFDVSAWSTSFFNGLNEAGEFTVTDDHLRIRYGNTRLELNKQ